MLSMNSVYGLLHLIFSVSIPTALLYFTFQQTFTWSLNLFPSLISPNSNFSFTVAFKFRSDFDGKHACQPSA